jgi:hypothetical protein
MKIRKQLVNEREAVSGLYEEIGGASAADYLSGRQSLRSRRLGSRFQSADDSGSNR